MRKVYFNSGDEYSEIAIVEEGVLEHFYRLKKNFLTGSIFIGKIKRVKKQIGVFVDIGLDKDGLLAYRDGLKTGDYVIVIVKKEPTESKGCALSEKITLAGRYAILNNTGEYKFSSKLSSECKNKLINVPKMEGTGYIFRSACEKADFEIIKSECLSLYNRYYGIKEKAKNTQKIICLWHDEALDTAKRFSLSDEEVIIGFDEIMEDIKGIGDRKVVSSGVELVFDKTEAMTVVDVNIHKFSGQYSDIEETNFQANIIAITELARQIRLRNIGGIIMVDYISLRDKEKTEMLKARLVEELRKDNVKTNVELIESIGIFVIVRKKRFDSI